MSREMKHSGIDWIGEIPRGWNITKFKFISEMYTGNSLNEHQKEYYSQFYNDGLALPYVSTKDVERDIERINYEGDFRIPEFETGFSIAPLNSVLLCIEGGSAGKKVGYTNQKICFVNKLCCINSKQNSRYLYFYILSNAFNEPFTQNIQGLIGGVSVNTLKNFYITTPSLSEQKKIANYLDKVCGEVDEMIALQEQMVEELKAYKQSVITEAVTKGLNPNVPMKDSGIDWIGEVPEHWELEPLKFCFGRRSEKNNPVKTKERLSLSIDKGVTLYAEKTTNLDRFKDDFTQYQLAYPNDIVLNCMNMIVGAVGLSKYMGCVSPVYYVVYPIKPKIDALYYSYLLNIPTIRGVYYSLGKGIYAIERGEGRVNTCRLKVSYDDFGRLDIPIPPLKEQKEITSYIQQKSSEIDALIAIKQAKIEELKEYKKSVIYEYVTGKKEVV